MLAQRRVAVEFLRHLAETRAALMDTSLSAEELLQAIEIWSDKAAWRSGSVRKKY
jgi:hypothetical protein